MRTRTVDMRALLSDPARITEDGLWTVPPESDENCRFSCPSGHAPFPFHLNDDGQSPVVPLLTALLRLATGDARSAG
jgi:hypothetical protein